MSHALAIAAGQAGLASDVAASVEGIGARLDAELQNVDGLDLDAIRSLARRIDSAYHGAGRRADGWRATALGILAAREHELLAGSNEDTTINLGTDGSRVAASSIGTDAERRAARARQGYRRR